MSGVGGSAETAHVEWPCDNYTEPITCLTVRTSETGQCRICRIRAADRLIAALRPSLADDVRTISRTISASYPANLDPEAHLWRRCMKVTEEAGEVFAALAGWLGENPRKGVTHNRADLRDELLDVAGAALGAASHLYGDTADPVEMLSARLAFVRARLLAAVSNPPGQQP